MAQSCEGVTKSGLRCSITWCLNEGFCKFHAPDAGQCRGIARSTGHRCRVKWDLNESGYCKFHVAQSKHLQCVAIAQSTGQRCQKTVGIGQDGFCLAHRPSNEKAPTCEGRVANSNMCKNPAKPHYKYCCAVHDPAIKFYSPRLFGDSKLRSNREKDVVRFYDGRDLYHGDRLDLTTDGFVEIDHILEKQCYSYAFNAIPFRDGEDIDFLATLVRENVVNELPNLCFTRATTNKIKGAAVWKFLDDCLTGHVGYRGSTTFNGYLLAENRDAVRLGRETSRIISSEMGTALKFCQRKLADEGETPIIDALSNQLQNLYVRMQLHTSRSAVTLPARTGSQSPIAKCASAALRTHRPDIVSDPPHAVSKPLLTPRVFSPPQTNLQTDSTTETEPSVFVVGSCTNNEDNTLCRSVAGGETTMNKPESQADPKPAVPTQTRTKMKALDAFAKPFVPRAMQDYDLLHQTDRMTIVRDKRKDGLRENEQREEALEQIDHSSSQIFTVVSEDVRILDSGTPVLTPNSTITTQ